VSQNHYHARLAAAALLKMAKVASDPAFAAGVVETAAKLKEHVGELPAPDIPKTPDVETEE
jgi:hypothetical protein